MTLTILPELVQGSPEWLDARRGIITASAIGRLITEEASPASITTGLRNREAA